MGAVKVVTHDERRHNRRDTIYRRLLPASLSIAEISVTARFPMIAKDFIPEMGTKFFAIMKGLLEMRVRRGSGGRCDYLCSAGEKAFS
jgi:hypothetical protein